jgi:cytidylate kinase
MAGRDIGTVVLPDADLKVYLDASPRVRARRRAAQLRASGLAADVEALTADLQRRDDIDSSREASPLTAAADAVIMHTDDMGIDEVVERIVELAS